MGDNTEKLLNKKLNQNHPLYVAVINEDVDHLKKLLDDKTNQGYINDLFNNFEEKRNKEKTLLGLATENGYTTCVSTLIDMGADLNKRSSNGKTPLYIAAENGHKECLNLLLHKNANINKTGPFGTTPAFIAALKKHQDCLMLLKENDASVRRNQTIFETDADAKEIHEAVKLGNVETLKNKIKHFLKYLGNRDEEGKTLFHIAVENNQIECLKVLIENETYMKNMKAIEKNVIDKVNVYGHTPLYIAAQLGSDCFTLLKDNGASLSKASYCAASEGEKEWLKNFIHEDIDFSYQAYKPCLIEEAVDPHDKNDCYSKCENCCINIYKKFEETFECCKDDSENQEGETQCLKCFLEQDFKLDTGSKDEQEGLCHDCDDSDSTSLVEEMFIHVSEPVNFIKDVFNSTSVVIEKSKNNKQKNYKVDFKFFLPKENRDQGQMHVFACLLNAMNSEEETEVLNHILCQIFLDAKLKTETLFWILFLRLFLWYSYFICVVFYTAIVLKIVELPFNHTWIIFTTCIFLLIRFLLQLNQIRLLWNDHNSRIYSIWTVINTVMVMVSVTFTIFYLLVTVSFLNISMLHDSELSTLKSVSAIVIVILHNIEFILIHLKFTVVGQYYAMFLTVLYKTLKAIAFLILPIICFIFIFHLQFAYYSEFSTIFRTIVKTIVLMTGEFEYENTLHNKLHNATSDVTNNMSSRLSISTPDRDNLHFFYVRFVFLIFIVLINLVMFNLILGLSVDNVAEAKNAGNAVAIRQKAEFCIQVEEFLSLMKTKKWCKGWIQKIVEYLEDNSNIQSPYKMKRSKFPLIRQKTFESLEELVRNNRLSRKQKKDWSTLYVSNTKSIDVSKKGSENVAQSID